MAATRSGAQEADRPPLAATPPSTTAGSTVTPPPDLEARGGEEEEVLKAVILEKTAKEEQPVAGPLHPALPPPEQPPPPLSRTLLLYASLRLNLNYGGDGDWDATDGASRVGSIGLYQLSQEASLLGRVELGFNLVDQFSALVTPDASAADGRNNTVFNPRLYYAGYEHAGTQLLAGKNWSAYYEVAGLTDRFAVGGGRAAGVYNAGTDGGGSGTGRADQVLQLRGRHLRWTYGLQAQYRTTIPVFDGERFDYGLGISLLHKTTEGLTLGVAGNYARPASITGAMRDQGFDGDDTSLALGLQFGRDNLTLATTYAASRNHETDDEDVFFDARGWEVYTRYNFAKRFRVTAGLNLLEPDKAVYEGAYQVEDYLVGTQYALGEPTFDRMIYVHVLFSRGRLADGTDPGNRLTFGVRWGWSG
jgi:hypothetical protein